MTRTYEHINDNRYTKLRALYQNICCHLMVEFYTHLVKHEPYTWRYPCDWFREHKWKLQEEISNL